MASHVSQLERRKRQLRVEARAARSAEPSKDAASARICETLAGVPEYGTAETLMLYVSFGDEVRTRSLLADALNAGRAVVVPYCAGHELELFRLTTMEELAPSAFGILEPKAELRSRPGSRIEVRRIDFVVVPGVAFDRRGGRLGFGRGYYDKLLCRARADTLLTALAFDCQVFPQVPMLPDDVPMDKVITETAVYEGVGR